MKGSRNIEVAAIMAVIVAGCRSRHTELETTVARDSGAITVHELDAKRDASVRSALRARLESREPSSKPLPPLQRKHRFGDCAAAYAPRPERDPNPMCKVTGGTFAFGPDGKPTTVRDFYIDQFEVSVAQAVLFLNARGDNLCPGLDHPHPSVGANPCIHGAESPDSEIVVRDGRYEARRGYEQTSTLNFSWQGAIEYCAWVGKQVPSSAQWEYAGRHDPRTGKDYAYPWGDRWLPKRASCWLPPECDAPPEPKHGRSWIGLFDGREGRGDGSSPWGLHDMVGGASELVFACADPEATCSVDAPCTCVPQEILSDAASIDELRLTHRTTPRGIGVQGLRCMRR